MQIVDEPVRTPLVQALLGEALHTGSDRAVRFPKNAGWKCVSLHPTHRVIPSVGLDAFKLAGPTNSLPNAWQLVCDAALKLDPPRAFRPGASLGLTTVGHRCCGSRVEAPAAIQCLELLGISRISLDFFIFTRICHRILLGFY